MATKMNINTLGLLNQMSHIINEENDTSDYVITKYLLENIRNLSTISINDIVDNAHVSISSVRRYSKRMGFDNFSKLKESFDDIAFPSNIHLREFYDFQQYQSQLEKGFLKMQEELNEVLTESMIRKFSDDIRNHNNVYILCANNTAGNMVKFQQELMYASKVVKIISSNFDVDYTSHGNDKNTLYIVVSISGVFTKAVKGFINSVDGKKVLVTANRNKEFYFDYDEIIYISSRDVNVDKLGLLGKYGVTYFFDFVSQYYIYETLQSI